MSKSIQSLIIMAVLAAFASAPPVRAVTITSCDEATVKNAVATHLAEFAIDCHLFLSSPINITGNTFIGGEGFTVTLDGGHTTGVIHVPSGAILNIRGATIVNGRTSSSTGGGIANAGSLTVSFCNFSGNTNAILNTGSLSVTESTFTGNTAPSGGAIIHTGPTKAFITFSSFGTSGTPSSGNGGGQTGGAIYMSGASAEIDNSTFADNIATQGGAIYAYLSTVTLTGDSFVSNSTNPGGIGGAIANLGSNVTVTNTSASSGGFQSNQAVSSSTTAGLGGAIYTAGVETFSCSTFCFPIFHTPSLTLNSVYLAHNSASNGGAIYNLGNSFLGSTGGLTNVTDSYFYQNQAETIDPSEGPNFSESTGGAGAAIDNEGIAALGITGSTFQNDIALLGAVPNGHYVGPGAIRNLGSLNVFNSTFYGEITAPAIDTESAGATVEYSTLLTTFTSFGSLSGGQIKLESSTVGGPEGCNPLYTVHVIDGGYNLESDNTCGLTAATSLVNTNPNISTSSFGFNGGPTPTFALPTGSPAIDKIPVGTLTCGVLGTAPNYNPGAFDQRGVSRPQGLECDMGAIEHLFSNLPTSGTACDGVYNKTFTGTIDVLPGQNCVFLSGGVTGNVTVHGGRFELRYASVGGDVEIFGDSGFSIGPSAAIGGNLEIHNLDSSTAQGQVCGANVTGNLEVHNNDAAVAIGAQDQTTCPGNTIGGSLDVHNNGSATTLDGNTVTGDLDDHNNGGATEVFNNLIQGSLACHQNFAITGGLDTAKQEQGQCANF